MFGNLFERPSALIVIVLLAIIVFGWKRLPDAARSLGRSARILKSEIGEMQEEGGKKSDAANTTVPGETVPPQTANSVPGEAPVQQPPAQSYAQQPPVQAYPQQPTGTNSDRPTGA